MSHEQAAVLRDAAEILERDGHCKHALHGADGSHCAMGAIAKSLAHSSILPATLYDFLQIRLLSGRSLPAWNDRPETTMQDVQKLFLKAADELEFAE